MFSSPGSAIIVFDGVCVFCSRWVRLLIQYDTARKFRFATAQSSAGRELLLKHGLVPDNPASFLLIDGDGCWTEAQAVGRVLSALGGIWRFPAGLMMLIPRAMSNRGYRLVARNRYEWFGKLDRCVVPEPSDLDRFME